LDDPGVDKRTVESAIPSRTTPWMNREVLSTLVVGLVGLLWMVVGFAGNASIAIVVGAFLLAAGAISAALLQLRKSA